MVTWKGTCSLCLRQGKGPGTLCSPGRCSSCKAAHRCGSIGRDVAKDWPWLSCLGHKRTNSHGLSRGSAGSSQLNGLLGWQSRAITGAPGTVGTQAHHRPRAGLPSATSAWLSQLCPSNGLEVVRVQCELRQLSISYSTSLHPHSHDNAGPCRVLGSQGPFRNHLAVSVCPQSFLQGASSGFHKAEAAVQPECCNVIRLDHDAHRDSWAGISPASKMLEYGPAELSTQASAPMARRRVQAEHLPLILLVVRGRYCLPRLGRELKVGRRDRPSNRDLCNPFRGTLATLKDAGKNVLSRLAQPGHPDVIWELRFDLPC